MGVDKIKMYYKKHSKTILFHYPRFMQHGHCKHPETNTLQSVRCSGCSVLLAPLRADFDQVFQVKIDHGRAVRV